MIRRGNMGSWDSNYFYEEPCWITIHVLFIPRASKYSWSWNHQFLINIFRKHLQIFFKLQISHKNYRHIKNRLLHSNAFFKFQRCFDKSYSFMFNQRYDRKVVLTQCHLHTLLLTDKKVSHFQEGFKTLWGKKSHCLKDG